MNIVKQYQLYPVAYSQLRVGDTVMLRDVVRGLEVRKPYKIHEIMDCTKEYGGKTCSTCKSDFYCIFVLPEGHLAPYACCCVRFTNARGKDIIAGCRNQVANRSDLN